MPRYNDGTKAEIAALLKAAAYECGPNALSLVLWSKGQWCEDQAHDGPIVLRDEGARVRELPHRGLSRRQRISSMRDTVSLLRNNPHQAPEFPGVPVGAAPAVHYSRPVGVD